MKKIIITIIASVLLGACGTNIKKEKAMDDVCVGFFTDVFTQSEITLWVTKGIIPLINENEIHIINKYADDTVKMEIELFKSYVRDMYTANDWMSIEGQKWIFCYTEEEGWEYMPYDYMGDRTVIWSIKDTTELWEHFITNSSKFREMAKIKYINECDSIDSVYNNVYIPEYKQFKEWCDTSKVLTKTNNRIFNEITNFVYWKHQMYLKGKIDNEYYGCIINVIAHEYTLGEVEETIWHTRGYDKEMSILNECRLILEHRNAKRFHSYTELLNYVNSDNVRIISHIY